MNREQALAEVSVERELQSVKWSAPHGWGEGDCSSPLVDPMVKLAVLTEEVGEVARALLERDPEGLKVELTQVAAVAVAWMEGLE